MRVEIKINPDITEVTAVIHAPKMTPDLVELVETLEGSEDKASLLIAKNDDKVFLIEPDQAEIIRTVGREIKLFDHKGQEYTLTKPLNNILERFSKHFVRISKSAIVNINRVDHLSRSFSGSMHIIMKNGMSDYISRKYLNDFQKRFDI
jgi:DNA-binding LytR/AlgR family response regulator